jgi:hypothetical protein
VRRLIVKPWYAQQLAEGSARYYSGGRASTSSERQSARTEARKRIKLGSDSAYWSQPDVETARGIETPADEHRELPATRPSDRIGSDPFSRRTANGTDPDGYARRAMVALEASDAIEYHHAVEMDAAGWTPAQMAAHFKVPEHQAQAWVNCGLAALSMYTLLQPAS